MKNVSRSKSQSGTAKTALPAVHEPSAAEATSTLRWPDPVDGEKLLDGLTASIRKYVVLEPGAAEATALWSVYTHAPDAFLISPRLGVTSPVMRCGKSTLLDVLHCLVQEPLVAANATAAGIFYAIEACHPTLLIDEADTFMDGKKELNGILNSGHRKTTATILRAKGQFSTWAPAVIARIGDLPETLADRCISVRLKRKRNDEVISTFRPDRADDLARLCRMSARWATDNLTHLTDAEPEVPIDLTDRAADNWRPLFAIADAAGGKWPALARKAAASLNADKLIAAPDTAVMLLEDIYTVSRNSAGDLPSADLAIALTKFDNRPWADFKGGQPITAKAIANLLIPFRIEPVLMRKGQKVLRGYRVAQFEDAFARYVPAAALRPAPPEKTRRNTGKVNRAVARP